MADIIQWRRDTAGNWTANNPVLAEGEFGYETDNLLGKLGNGVDDWNTLPYTSSLGGVIQPGTEGQTLRWSGTLSQWEANSDLIVADTGRVGIGQTPTGNDRLSVTRDTGSATTGSFRTVSINADSTGVLNGEFGVGLVLSVNGIEKGRITANENDALLFENGSSVERMRVTSTGDVGIGTAAPDHRLSVETDTSTPVAAVFARGANASNFSTYVNYGNTSTTVGRYIQADGTAIMAFGSTTDITASNGGTRTEHVRIDGSGNLLVGRTTQITGTAKLTVQAPASDVATRFYKASSSGTISAWHSDVGGTATQVASINVNGTYTPPSDIRLKENVRDLEDGLATALALRSVMFDWINGGEDNYGFIAQEVQPLLPSAINAADDEQGTLQLDKTAIIPVLVKAIQELTARVEALENG